MKISKTRLKEIIKEEFSTALKDDWLDPPHTRLQQVATSIGAPKDFAPAVRDAITTAVSTPDSTGASMATMEMANALEMLSPIQEGLRASRIRHRSAKELANALLQLEEVMKLLLHQKMTSDPGSPEQLDAQERLQRLAAVAQNYADVGAFRENRAQNKYGSKE
tara:strand:+ start:182 stop:673 length:492 start_codon:yes stop_codon:yes gene_type:complete